MEEKDESEDEGSMYDPLLDNIDLETLMEEGDEFLDPVAGMVEEEDPAHETRGDVATRQKPGTPGAVPNEDRSRHQRSASLTLGQCSE